LTGHLLEIPNTPKLNVLRIGMLFPCTMALVI
jgi:hypothetical protein